MRVCKGLWVVQARRVFYSVCTGFHGLYAGVEGFLRICKGLIECRIKGYCGLYKNLRCLRFVLGSQPYP